MNIICFTDTGVASTNHCHPPVSFKSPSLPAEVQSVGCMTTSELDDLSLQEKNILIYIGGYIVRKLSAKACEPCRTLISSEISRQPTQTTLSSE